MAEIFATVEVEFLLTIDFLRHGALEGGVKYRGHLNDALTSQGRGSMDKVWQELKGDVSDIISSPLQRCAQPAQDWAENKGIPCALDVRIQELFYGAWEGMTFQEIHAQTPELLQQWRADPTHLEPPQGESMQAFAKRTQAFLDELMSKEKDRHVLVVAHSGSIRLMLAQALNAPIKSTRHLAMPYACWSRITIENKQTSLVFHGREV